MAKTEQDNHEPIESLIKLLRTGDMIERTSAAVCLGQVGPRAALAVDALAATLCDPDNPATAQEAARSLGEIGPDARRAIPVLIQAMQQFPNEGRAWFAAETLGRISDPSDARVRAALSAATHGNRSLCSFAEYGLKELDSPNNRSTTEPTLQF